MENNTPFKILGYKRDEKKKNILRYYYQTDCGIMAITIEQHTPKRLLVLAPLSWWELHFPKKSGVDWLSAWDMLQRGTAQAGAFQSPQGLINSTKSPS